MRGFKKGIPDIGDGLGRDGHTNRYHGTGLQQGDIIIQGSFQDQGPEPFVGKEKLNNDNPGQQPVDLQHDDRKWRDQGIAQCMLDDDLLYGNPLSTAVRMYWEVITSAMDARVMRAT
jgi:hypothetical protein